MTTAMTTKNAQTSNPENLQTWSPENYARNARFVSDLGMPVVELLAPKPGESILDLGCGDGALTLKLVHLGCNVVGVDASPDMIASAKALGLNASVVDGHALEFDTEFDAVFSNAALHWMNRPREVITGVWKALKPGGRFVGEFGGHGNVATILGAAEKLLADRGIHIESPVYFPTPEEYSTLLEAAGFEIRSIALIPRPTPLPGDAGDWLATFARYYVNALPIAEREGYLTEAVAALRPTLCDAGGNWTADYVRLRFCALKKAIP